MLYVHYITGDRCSIGDTDDWDTKEYTVKQVLGLAKKVKIHGVDGESITEFSFEDYAKALMARDKLHGFESKYEVNYKISENRLGYVCLTHLDLDDNSKYHVPDGVFAITAQPEEGDSCKIRSKGRFSIVLPKSCKIIRDESFKQKEIESINLNYITTVGNSAFYECRYLKEVDFSRNSEGDTFKDNETGHMPKFLGASCFKYSGVESVNLGYMVAVSRECFMNCMSLKSVIAKGTRNIGDAAFEGCLNLQSVEFGDGETILSRSSFMSCISLRNINLDNVWSGDNAFANCPSLPQNS